MGGAPSTGLSPSPKRKSKSLGYMSDFEIAMMDQDAEVQRRSAEWAKRDLFRSMPLVIKGVKSKGGDSIKPDLIMTIDVKKFTVQAGARNDAKAQEELVQSIADLPDSVVVKENGDLVVIYSSDAESPSRRDVRAAPHRISGMALVELRDAPAAPSPPTHDASTPSTLTVAWELPNGGDPSGVIDLTEVQCRRAVRGLD